MTVTAVQNPFDEGCEQELEDLLREYREARTRHRSSRTGVGNDDEKTEEKAVNVTEAAIRLAERVDELFPQLVETLEEARAGMEELDKLEKREEERQKLSDVVHRITK